MLLAGMITNLKHIKHFVRDTEVVIRIDTLLTANDGRDYYGITAWYINNMYRLNNFIDRVKIELNKATIKNKIYLIKFDFGSNSKTFKYKHE